MYDLSRVDSIITINAPEPVFPISEWKEMGELAIRYGVIATQFDFDETDNDFTFGIVGNKFFFCQNGSRIEAFPAMFSTNNAGDAYRISQMLMRAVTFALDANIIATVSA